MALLSMQVVREAYPDLTAQDKASKYYDAKATPEDPRWSMVDFKLVRTCGCCRGGCLVLQPGRLSVAASARGVHTTPQAAPRLFTGAATLQS